MNRVGAVASCTPLPSDSHETKKLKETCKDFEAVFLGFVLKSMRKTVTKTDLFGTGSEEEMFQDMMDNEICNSAAHTQSMGIANMLYKQLSGSVTATAGADADLTRGEKK